VDELAVIRGRAWLLGDNVDTDQIIQGRYLTLLDYDEMAKHALEIPRPDFVTGVRKGDILVAGRNLGGGSSREEAPMVLKKRGVGCVIAESFARLFYRNGFNVGLALLTIPDVTRVVGDGMKLEVRLREGEVTLVETRKRLVGKPLPDFMMRMLKAGGAVALYRESQKR
jgi:3-isopropylmalate/(R)-2-methylmalate dehydratase small subunit